MQSRAQYVSLTAMLIVSLALIASCSGGTDDVTVGAPSTSAAPDTTAAPTTIPTTTAAPTTAAPATSADPLQPDLRPFVFSAMTQDGIISEANARCAVDAMSDELVDGFFNLDSLEPQAFQAAVAELFDIQSQCLTPAEIEAMGGFAPAG